MRKETAEYRTWRRSLFSPKSLLRFEILSISIAFAVPLLEWCFHAQTSPHFAREWIFSFVYANCIGFPLWNVTPQLWERTTRRSKAIRWMMRGGVILAGTTIGCMVGDLILFPFLSGGWAAYWRELGSSFRLSLVISAVVTIFVGMSEHLHSELRRREAELRSREAELQLKELERERALKLATEARLASLESRIHPHFLFNTINSVSSLIHEDPERAERLLTQMAALLRFSLDSAQAGLVPLDRELKIVRDYFDIEAARFGTRLRYEIQIPDDLMQLSVPPLALQTLVENSVKYAVSSRRQGAFIRVSATCREDFVALRVSDDGPGFSRFELPSGHGLNNLEERLHALFEGRAKLSVSSSAAGASVEVDLPRRASPLKQALSEVSPLGATG